MSNSLQSSSYCFPGTQDSSDPILSNTFIKEVHRDKDEDKWLLKVANKNKRGKVS